MGRPASQLVPAGRPQRGRGVVLEVREPHTALWHTRQQELCVCVCVAAAPARLQVWASTPRSRASCHHVDQRDEPVAKDAIAAAPAAARVGAPSFCAASAAALTGNASARAPRRRRRQHSLCSNQTNHVHPAPQRQETVKRPARTRWSRSAAHRPRSRGSSVAASAAARCVVAGRRGRRGRRKQQQPRHHRSNRSSNAPPRASTAAKDEPAAAASRHPPRLAEL